MSLRIPHTLRKNLARATVRRPARGPVARLRVLDLEDRLAPATYTVTNTNDAGAGSLRDAITQANATAAADTINFDTSGVFGSAQTISLLSALPQVVAAGGPLTITGTGAANLTVKRDSGASTNFRIFDSTTASLN